MKVDNVLHQLVKLLERDTELHDAVVDLINATAEAKYALAEWRKNRIKE